MLLEVVISALLVGLIAVGTFSAFDAAGKSTAGSRAHAQATVIAQQDEERLRGQTTTQLAQLGSVETARAENGYCLEQVSGAWHYWSKGSTSFCENPTGLSGTAYSATVFTVTSSATYVAAEKGSEKAAFTCEKTGGAASYLQTTSSVSWTAIGTRPPVSQSSILTVPTSGVLLVKVLNQNNEAVEGATVTVTGTGVNTTQTTPSSGCVIFGGLPAETVEVDASKSNWVDHQGKSPPKAISGLTLSTTSVTEATFNIGEPGKIVAEFESNGSIASVTGDTVYALQTEMTSPPDYIGGTAGTYASSVAVTGIEGKGLFPFVKVGEPPGTAPYRVFAGACGADNPEKVTETGEKLAAPSAQVNPNSEKTVKVEVPALTVNVYEGTSSSSNLLPKSEHAMIIDKGCEKEKVTAQNPGVAEFYKHAVEIHEGHLVQNYQPYSKELALCVVAEIGSKKWYKYESPTSFENKVKSGTTVGAIYMKATGSGYEKSETAGKLTCP
jgi:hypothetical protein